jgi:hypothetical protein
MTFRRRSEYKFSLFAFIDVMLCTIGSLIMLLLIFAERQHSAALVEMEASEVAVAQPAAPSVDDIADQIAEQTKLSEAAQQLSDLRSQLEKQFQTTQFDLSHLEDHIRRLREQMAKLEADYNVIKQSSDAESETREEKLARLSDLARKIAAAKAELDEAQKNATAKPRSFAIIPYDGPNGTRRRPIYIECCKDQVILQPEGTILLASDFRPPLDAGNPLAAALRATREYWLKSGSLQGSEPYPLLLVRPEGAEMYTLARSAMQSWSTEYGYELVEGNMQLRYPPADEALGDVVRRTVDLSRQRTEHLAMRGGGVGGGGGGSGGSQRGSSRGPARLYSGNGASGEAPYAVASRDGGFQVHGERPDPLLDNHLGPQGGYSGSGSLPSVGNIRNGHTGGLGNGGNGRGTGTAPAMGGGFYPPEQPRGTGSQFTETPNGNQQPNEQFGGAQQSGSTQPQTGPAQLTQSGGQTATAAPNANNNPFAPGGQAGGSPGGTSIASRGTQAPAGGGTSGRMGSSAGSEPQLTEREYNALADARGENWALPNSSPRATPFTRPIRIECHADKLIVMPDRGTTGAAKTVTVNGNLENSIDSLVGHLWNHMKGWGMAGPQAYWKPLLSVHVAPGGEDRFAELSALMQRSGVDVEWKR